MKFELICTDKFQTLVNVDTRIPFIWRRILKGKYDEKLAFECAESISKNVFNEFHKSASNNREFINLKTMFRLFFNTVLKEMNISFDSKEAVKIFMDEHTNASPFDDVENFFAIYSAIYGIYDNTFIKIVNDTKDIYGVYFKYENIRK
jgi:FMN hydrolase / 5-amino-6-(5-phospho-D-ribitylamino)uracil phosphatase